jgi:hypothetical protein
MFFYLRKTDIRVTKKYVCTYLYSTFAIKYSPVKGVLSLHPYPILLARNKFQVPPLSRGFQPRVSGAGSREITGAFQEFCLSQGL